jgi:hypothetical protein
MTEAEWLAGDDPEAMFRFLAGRGGSRPWRLFACACLRELGHLLQDDAREAFAVAQRFADRRADAAEVAAAHARALASRRHLVSRSSPRSRLDRRLSARMQGVAEALLQATAPADDPEAQAVAVARTLLHADPHEPAWQARVGERTAWLLRDVFGDPFRVVDLAAGWLRGRGAQAVAVAGAIYEDQSFDELPILADALEDADCPAAGLIRHCREPGPHGRGCWAVEALRRAEDC